MPDKLKFVVTDYIEDDLQWEREECEKLGIDFECHQLKFAPIEEVAEKTADADIVLVNMVPVTPELIAKWEEPKLVIRHGIGYDNVNVPALTEAGIVMSYQPDYCCDEVAEHAIALLFACVRKVRQGRRVLEESAERGQWDFSDIFPMYRIGGKTLGIIGCGRVGSLVLQKLRSFGMNILVCDPYLSDERKRELDIQVVPHQQVYEEADFITIHTPLNDETREMINAQVFDRMKETAIFVNTARAGIVATQDLVDAIEQGKIAAAAVDVYDREPPPADHPLFQFENVVLAPHLAWCSVEAGWQIRENIMEDVRRFIEGRAPRFCLNPETLEAAGLKEGDKG